MVVRLRRIQHPAGWQRGMRGLRKLDGPAMARRVAQEFLAGEVVGLGPGLPGLIPGELPAGAGIFFLAESGALGYRTPEESEEQRTSASAGHEGSVDSGGQGIVLLGGGVALSLVDLAAMVHGGHVGTAVLEPAQVTASGDFAHWTSAAAAGLFAPGAAVDWASGAGRLIAMMPHRGQNGDANIVAQPSLPLDGAGCVGLIVTDLAVLRVTPGGLVLAELAPGWRIDDVAAATGAPLSPAWDLREMTFELLRLEHPNKVYSSGLAALRDLTDGAVVNIDGFAGPGGMAHYLLVALRDHGARDLTIISNTAGIAQVVNFGTPPGRRAIDHSILVDNKQVKKAIASYPVSPSASRPTSFELAFQRGEVELEVVPQGTLAERLRAGGAGIAAFYTPTGAGTLLAAGKETRRIDGREYVLEHGLLADFCLIRGHKADTLGNVVYRGTSRNFNAVMAPAARVTVVEVDEVVAPGGLGPEEIVTPGVYIDRIVKRPAAFSPYE